MRKNESHIKATKMRDKDTQLIWEQYKSPGREGDPKKSIPFPDGRGEMGEREARDPGDVDSVVKQIRTTRYALMQFQKYVRELFDNPRDVEQFVQDQRHEVLPGDSEEDFKRKQADLVDRLTIALDYADGDENKLNHLFAQLDAAEERFQKGADFDDDIPGADDGDRYSTGPDIYAAADRDDRAMPPR